MALCVKKLSRDLAILEGKTSRRELDGQVNWRLSNTKGYPKLDLSQVI